RAFFDRYMHQLTALTRPKLATGQRSRGQAELQSRQKGNAPRMNRATIKAGSQRLRISLTIGLFSRSTCADPMPGILDFRRCSMVFSQYLIRAIRCMRDAS